MSKSIYLAGKIGKNDWRHWLLPLRYSDWCECEEQAPFPWPVIPRGVLSTFDYVGPYFISDDHGCAHGENTHGCATAGDACGGTIPGASRTMVRDLCMDAIDRADIVFAWLDDPTAYGTLVEIGYARGLGKRVVIAAPYETPDLWFAHTMAEFLRARTPEGALAQLAIQERQRPQLSAA